MRVLIVAAMHSSAPAASPGPPLGIHAHTYGGQRHSVAAAAPPPHLATQPWSSGSSSDGSPLLLRPCRPDPRTPLPADSMLLLDIVLLRTKRCCGPGAGFQGPAGDARRASAEHRETAPPSLNEGGRTCSPFGSTATVPEASLVQFPQPTEPPLRSIEDAQAAGHIPVLRPPSPHGHTSKRFSAERGAPQTLTHLLKAHKALAQEEVTQEMWGLIGTPEPQTRPRHA